MSVSDEQSVGVPVGLRLRMGVGAVEVTLAVVPNSSTVSTVQKCVDAHTDYTSTAGSG